MWFLNPNLSSMKEEKVIISMKMLPEIVALSDLVK